MFAVGVFVDLWWRSNAGGHVKCWERFAEAAIAFSDQLDLTVHFLGEQEAVIPLSPSVRFVTLPPLLGTQCFWFLNRQMVEHTDLAPFNPKLLTYLQRYQILHATHPLFSFGQTILRYSKRQGTPLVCSLHTDVLQYTEIYINHLIQQSFGWSGFSYLLLKQWRVDQRYIAGMKRRLQHYWSNCSHVLVSQPTDYEQVSQILPTDRITYLRRGINQTQFHPSKADRQQITQTYRIAPDTHLLLFVGRLEPSKGVMTLARAAHRLREAGLPIHVIFAGEGECAAEIQALLGASATLTGVLPQPALATLYASADLFVFPSTTETYGNVVLEAKASGLPILLASEGGASQLIKQPGEDGLLVRNNQPEGWAEAIATLLKNEHKLAVMRQKIRSQIEADHPSWETVLKEDLLPIWKASASK